MIKKNIPNAITLANLFFGCCAILSILYGHYVQAFWWVFASVVADYADGLVARMLGVHSELGKELDSIADTVSFGVVPGMIYYSLLCVALGVEDTGMLQYAALPAFLVPAFSGLRLAKFNLDTRQTDGFIGLPTPSSTMFTVGLMLMYALDSYGLADWIVSPALLYICILLQSYLLVAEIPMFALKFKSFSWSGNEIKFTFAAIALLLLIFTQEVAFSAVVLLYVLFSVFRHLTQQRERP